MPTSPPPPPDFTVIVPTRLAATRLPNKPLADLGGLPLIVRVLHQAAASGAARVAAAVARGDAALIAAVTRAGYPAIPTGDHDSGGARIAEAAAILRLPPHTLVINLQGDEPFLEPNLIAATAATAAAHPDAACATPCRPLAGAAEYNDPAVVKVTADKHDRALYFSRAPIPYGRAGVIPATARAHIGLYAYRLQSLNHYQALPPAPQEQSEQLEQLRILWHGGTILLHPCQSHGFGIDTPEDLARARARLAASPPPPTP